MSYTQKNLRDVKDSAAEHGFGEIQEARFPRGDVGLAQSGLAHIRVKPGQRQPFAHRHADAEEVHVILSGTGTMKIDDELLDAFSVTASWDGLGDALLRRFSGLADRVFPYATPGLSDPSVAERWRAVAAAVSAGS